MVDFYSNVNDGGKGFITLALGVNVKLSSLKIETDKLEVFVYQVASEACGLYYNSFTIEWPVL
jgi:hypothetical protein